MSADSIPFWRLLVVAEEQLDWGTDPDVLEKAAQALFRVEPDSIVAAQLLARSANLRVVQRRLPQHA
ncbi:MAG: hypothetical protein K2Y56_17685 [Methylobacterium sp.]|uniref:hypothetical protein n=1 Tax=Methylobacterium sp. TaxID=409 RepID=UPI0025F1AEED|nr:hypothetical protein [Methylobacterium sp.]MBX9933339.1 hypothetical protein [Methylobacterium sp.]